MPDEGINSAGSEAKDGLSRRDLLRRISLAGAGLALGPAILAACGSSKKSTTTPTTSATTAAPSSGTTAAPSSATTGGGAPSGSAGQQLATMLKIDPSGKNGKGVTWQMGAVLALTGNGSFYGKTMSRGIDLAVKHIAAAGGPNIKVIYKDHKSGDPQAGIQAMTELGTSHVPAKLASYADDLYVMLPLTAKYKCFTLDGGGGTGTSAQGKPYFWGCRAITPNDTLGGLFKYIKAKTPSVKTIGIAGWDVGAASDAATLATSKKAIADAGLTYNGLYELFPPNTTDYSATLSKISAKEPDVLLLGVYGQDPGFFINQAQTASLKSTVYGFEFTPDGVNASKGAYDNAGWNFTYDYFDPASVPNPLGKLFVSEFTSAYGTPPDFYAANYYEDTLGMWDLMRRVLAKGGDINSGAALEAEMVANPSLTTVYGGTATTIDTFTCDPVTHTPTKREMGVFRYQHKKVTPLAYFNIGATDFRLA